MSDAHSPNGQVTFTRAERFRRDRLAMGDDCSHWKAAHV